MRNKFLLTLAVLCMMGGVAFADATTTSTWNSRQGVYDRANSIVGVADLSNGYTQNIDSDGAAFVMEKSAAITSSTGLTLNTGTALYTGAARVKSITVGGVGTSAGDYVLIYDNTSATGTPVFEASVGTAKDTNHIVIPGGADFSTGIFADSNSDNVHVAVSYDY